MKKLINIFNPFALLLIPILFALVLGISYQLKGNQVESTGKEMSTVFAKKANLFNASIYLIKQVLNCGDFKQTKI
jgi:hypothetical protein